MGVVYCGSDGMFLCALTVAMGTEEKLKEVCYLTRPLLPLVPHLLVSLGKDGMAYLNPDIGEGLLYSPAPPNLLPVDVVSVTGAGDR